VNPRPILRARRYDLSELRAVEVVERRTGFAGVGREHLVFRRADGGDVAFKDLNFLVSKSPEATSVVWPRGGVHQRAAVTGVTNSALP
jgi:hypothetical protein